MKIISLGLDNSALNKNSALAKRLAKYGDLAEIFLVIVPGAEKTRVQLSERAGVYSSGGGNKLTQLVKIYSLAKRILREEKYDVITVQDQYYLALIGFILSKQFKIGLEVQVHGFEKFYGLRKLIAKFVLPKANSVRCVSLRLKEELNVKFGVDEQKITVVPIFIEVRSKKLEVRSEKNYVKFVFLTVGRLVSVKNIGMQIEAMREVVKKHSNTELWVVGDGPERKNYELRIKNYQLNDNIKLLGWQDNLEEYYKQAGAFLLTSNSEGWGMAIVEAAGYSLPIIMTDVGLAGEVIKDGKSGLVIPVGDKQKLVEAMLRLVEDGQLRKTLADNARLAVSKLPSEEQTINLYKESWQKSVLR
jgi:glycosyltransferase involved in cell wall biosynthesis